MKEYPLKNQYGFAMGLIADFDGFSGFLIIFDNRIKLTCI